MARSVRQTPVRILLSNEAFGEAVAEYDQQRFMQAEARKNQIENERMATDARVQKQEQVHGKNRVFGVTFYAFILGLCIGVCALGGFLLFMSGR